MNGIGGKVESDGQVDIELNNLNNKFRHTFYVLNKIPGGNNGILGQDFLRKYNAILNFETNTLKLTLASGKPIYL